MIIVFPLLVQVSELLLISALIQVLQPIIIIWDTSWAIFPSCQRTWRRAFFNFLIFFLFLISSSFSSFLSFWQHATKSNEHTQTHTYHLFHWRNGNRRRLNIIYTYKLNINTCTYNIIHTCRLEVCLSIQGSAINSGCVTGCVSWEGYFT